MKLLEWFKLISVTLLVLFVLEFVTFGLFYLFNTKAILYVGSTISIAFSVLVSIGIYSLMSYKK